MRSQSSSDKMGKTKVCVNGEAKRKEEEEAVEGIEDGREVGANKEIEGGENEEIMPNVEAIDDGRGQGARHYIQ